MLHNGKPTKGDLAIPMKLKAPPPEVKTVPENVHKSMSIQGNGKVCQPAAQIKLDSLL